MTASDHTPASASEQSYWLDNRAAVLDAIEKAGFRLMSNSGSFWLSPVPSPGSQVDEGNRLHAQIMNIPGLPERHDATFVLGYKQGHRDARHAAAELALAPKGTSGSDALDGTALFALARKCAGSSHTLNCLTLNADDFDKLAAAIAAQAEVDPS